MNLRTFDLQSKVVFVSSKNTVVVAVPNDNKNNDIETKKNYISQRNSLHSNIIQQKQPASDTILRGIRYWRRENVEVYKERVSIKKRKGSSYCALGWDIGQLLEFWNEKVSLIYGLFLL